MQIKLTMLLKLAIIAGIVIIGIMMFSNETTNLFPSTSSTMPGALEKDVSSLSSKTSDFVDEKMGDATDGITQATDGITQAADTAGSHIMDGFDNAQDAVLGDDDKKDITEESVQEDAKEDSGIDPFGQIQSIFSSDKDT